MSDYYDKVELSGDELADYYKGVDANIKFIVYFLIIPALFFLILIIAFYFNYGSSHIKKIAKIEILSISSVYDDMNDILIESESESLSSEIKKLKKSNPEEYMKIFKSYNPVDEQLFNSWGGYVYFNGGYSEGFNVVYYDVPSGLSCDVFLSGLIFSDWKSFEVSERSGIRYDFSELSAKDVESICYDSSLNKNITFYN